MTAHSAWRRIVAIVVVIVGLFAVIGSARAVSRDVVPVANGVRAAGGAGTGTAPQSPIGPKKVP